MLAEYLIVFAQAHHEFRIPELISVAKIHGFEVILPVLADLDTTRPFMKVSLQDEEHARTLARRCILIK
jgi:tRNA (guanine10-N2)-methyltransferase